MKKLLLLLFTISGLAQAPTIQWQKAYGGEFEDYGKCVKQTSDGGYITIGTTYSNNGYVSGNHGQADIWVLKLNATGGVQWQKSLGGSFNEEAYSIIQTSDGGYVIAGLGSSNDGDLYQSNCDGDYWIIKLDASGTILWQKVYGGGFTERPYDIIQTSDGGFIIAGETSTYIDSGYVTGCHGGFDFWIVKIDANGLFQWQKSLGSNAHDEAFSIKQTSEGGYIATGITHCSIGNNGNVTGSHGGGDYWVVKLSVNGTIEWQKSFGGSSSDYADDIIQTNDGGYIVAGSSGSSDGDITGHHGYYSDFWIIKLNALGELQWQKSLGGTGVDIARSIKQTADGNYIVVGNTKSLDGDVVGSTGSGSPMYWIVKINNVGSIIWQKVINGYGDNYAYSIDNTSDGGYIIAGDSSDSSHFYSPGLSQSYINFYLVKLGPDTLTTEGFEQNSLSVFPNPTTNLLNLKTSNDVIIDQVIITDLSGKTIIEKTQNTHQINTQDLAVGIYFIKAFSGTHKYQTKFIKQ